jgi:hypothetical protein
VSSLDIANARFCSVVVLAVADVMLGVAMALSSAHPVTCTVSLSLAALDYDAVVEHREQQ